MNRANTENNVVSFSSFAERVVHKSGNGGLRVKARLALAQGQKEAFLTELAGYMEEVLDNRAWAVQRLLGPVPEPCCRPVPSLRLVQGGIKQG